MKDDMPRFGKGERGIFKIDPVTHKSVKVEEKPKLKLAPAIATDTIEPIQSPISFKKKVFDSKSAYRRHLKENGFIDTGGEHFKDVPKEKTDEEITREMKDDIEKAYFDIKNGNVEFSEQEKENHLREERKWGKKYKVKPMY